MTRVRVHINEEEWYPVYDVFEGGGHGRYWVDTADMDRWQAAKDAYQAVRDEIDALITAQLQEEP